MVLGSFPTTSLRSRCTSMWTRADYDQVLIRDLESRLRRHKKLCI